MAFGLGIGKFCYRESVMRFVRMCLRTPWLRLHSTYLGSRIMDDGVFVLGTRIRMEFCGTVSRG